MGHVRQVVADPLQVAQLALQSRQLVPDSWVPAGQAEKQRFRVAEYSRLSEF